MEYDDEVAYHADPQALRPVARGQDERPWCLTVSFTHPHDPYVARRQILGPLRRLPGARPAGRAHPLRRSRTRIRAACSMPATTTPSTLRREDVRRARQGYFANISYVDEKIGELLDVLERTPHGRQYRRRLRLRSWRHAGRARPVVQDELLRRLGARAADDRRAGLDAAAGSTRRSRRSTSTPTLAALAGIDISEHRAVDRRRRSCAARARARATRGPVPMEYAAEGSVAPLVCLRDGRLQAGAVRQGPADAVRSRRRSARARQPGRRPGHAATLDELTRRCSARWNLAAFDAAVRESQARRHVVYRALRNGAYFPWDYQPLQKASERYMRNHMDLNVLEESQRFPRGE